MHDSFARIRAHFDVALATFQASPGMQRLVKGNVGVEHYKSYLRQVFHQTRENPQIQACATVYFRGAQRGLVRKFYAHASSEIGHDQLALNDLAALGEDVSAIPFETPLPSTTALISFAYYQIQHLNPIGYLGYLFFLEFTPTSQGASYINMLRSFGVPDTALTFLQEHSTIDVGHNRLMESYAAELIRNEADMESVLYAVDVTASLYGRMFADACDVADLGQHHRKAWHEAFRARPATDAA
jgi:Iron-containing redox enzyme